MSSDSPHDTPPSYEDIQAWVEAAEARLNQLNAELQRTPRRLTLDYTPPGTAELPDQEPFRPRQEIQAERDRVKAATMERVERATTRLPTTTRQQVRDGVFGQLYAEEIQKVADTEHGRAAPSETWTLDDRQTRLRVDINTFRERAHGEPPPATPPLDELAARFLAKLKRPAAPAPPGSPREPEAPAAEKGR